MSFPSSGLGFFSARAARASRPSPGAGERPFGAFLFVAAPPASSGNYFPFSFLAGRPVTPIESTPVCPRRLYAQILGCRDVLPATNSGQLHLWYHLVGCLPAHDCVSKTFCFFPSCITTVLNLRGLLASPSSFLLRPSFLGPGYVVAAAPEASACSPPSGTPVCGKIPLCVGNANMMGLGHLARRLLSKNRTPVTLQFSAARPVWLPAVFCPCRSPLPRGLFEKSRL